MYFYLPTRIYSERDSVKKHGNEWACLGRKALIVTGKSSAENGALQDVIEALEKQGTSYFVFDETQQNPSVELVLEIRETGIEQQVDFVVGIGGGSPMDAAKAVALMLAHSDKGAEFLYERNIAGEQDYDAAFPVVEVPTTCGTGSEVTPYAILTRHDTCIKASLPHKIYPAYAVVDGKYLLGTKREIIVNTAVDTLGHFIESYINTNATDFSRMLCEYGLGVWRSVKNVLIGAGLTVQECDAMMFSSTLAGMAIAHTGTALPHGLSYYLTYENGVPHGRAVGDFLPGYLAASGPMIRKKILSYAGFPDMQYFTAFIHRLLGAEKMDEKLMKKAVSGLMSNESKLRNVPFEVTEDLLYRICNRYSQ